MQSKLLPSAVLLLCTLFISTATLAQHVFTAGPMLHLNFGGGKPAQLSGGFEIAYWNAFNIPYGVDLGVDFERGSWRLYSELQTGIVYGGISAGPYLEFFQDAPKKLGLQTSVWANAYLGFDIRARFSRGSSRYAPGTYAKYLWTPGGNLWDKFRENHESEGDGWDWN